LWLLREDFRKTTNKWTLQEGKALEVLTSVSVVNTKPVGSMAGAPLFSLACFGCA